ncbi:Endonuclease/exonuclease/phosphatase, partial [Ephemerocybe angulata]
RAALRIASLNMKGGGTAHTNGKWRTITRMMKTESINILALQETHLTEEHRLVLERRYDRVRIISSPDPDNESGKGGVAILLNKHNTNWQNVEIEQTIPGRVLSILVTWGHTSTMRIAAIYAPAGTTVEKAEFWTSLRDIWRAEPSKRPDVLLGDLNMVESALDRLPARADKSRVVEPFAELKDEAKLIDGWQATHAGGKPRYTFRTRKRGGVNSRSRIDRIYVTDEILENSYEWNIINTGIDTLDHYMVTAYVATSNTPYVGKGRSTIGDFILEFPELRDKFRERALELERALKNARTNRSPTNNPQTLWKGFKKDLLDIAKEFSRKRVSLIDREIGMWQKRKETIHNLENLEEQEDELILLDEIEDNITDLLAAKTLRQKTKMEARHHFVAETNTKYDYILHSEKKPRDTIPRLRKAGVEPAQYATSTNEMVEIATKHHEDLQDEYVHNPESPETGSARRRALNSLKPRLGGRDRNRLGRRIRCRDVERAVADIANGKASGLDGIPIEVWKVLTKEHKSESKKAKDGKSFKSTANITAILTSVLNDIVRHGVADNTDFAEGWMCPLYKKKDRADIANYRPITVLNTDYKVLTKILTNRL